MSLSKWPASAPWLASSTSRHFYVDALKSLLEDPEGDEFREVKLKMGLDSMGLRLS
jgi:hypothetical protein